MDLQQKKEQLIKGLINLGYLKNETVISAFRKVPRENFVLPEYRKDAYLNQPLPILKGQTISQPLTVAAMTEALDVKQGQKMLEVGAGSGYQAAILSELAGPNGTVITTEIIPELFEFARENLKNYKNVNAVKHDGSLGYEAEAPYDRIIVAARAESIPKALLAQLKTGGKMIIPVGDQMLLVEKIKENEFRKTFMGFYSFVPLTGKYDKN